MRYVNPLVVISLGAIVALGALGWYTASGLLDERQRLLMDNLQTDMEASVASIASLVSERARDIRSDLLTAVEIASTGHLPAVDHPDVVRAHLIALDRSTKHYRKLWHARGDDIVSEVSGFRRSASPIPELSEDSVLAVIRAAAAAPGKVATIVPTLEPEVLEPPVRQPQGKNTYLQLFALAAKGPAPAVVAVLVSMDTLFESLQKRARMPGADVWVIDAQGNTLVHPGDTGVGQRAEVIASLTSDVERGAKILGDGSHANSGRFLTWQSAQGPTLRWTTGMTTDLVPLRTELKRLSIQFMLIGATLLLAVAMAAILILLTSFRHRRLSERVAFVEQLSRAERLSTLGQIAASVAHEIGTPLGVISLRLDQLRENEAFAREVDKLTTMGEQIERITKIMRQMLDYGRPKPRNPQRVELRSVVERVQDFIDHRLKRQGLTLKINLPPDLTVLADFDETHQVFLNLLLNAADACERGGTIIVEGPALGVAHKTCVTVSDDGGGIPPQVLEHLFEPFFSTKPDGEGTGLGLTIVREILERERGSITATNLSKGACFTLCWPNTQAGAQDERP